MVKIIDILNCLREMAPEELAEPWDNCGLLVGSTREYAERVYVCLDVTQSIVNEAVAAGAELIVSHHPLIFKPIKRLAYERFPGIPETPGSTGAPVSPGTTGAPGSPGLPGTAGAPGSPAAILRTLIRGDVAVYAAHTNVDKTYGGLNDLLTGIMGLDANAPGGGGEQPGIYRLGMLPDALAADEFDEYTRARLKLANIITSPPDTAPTAVGHPGAQPRKRIAKVLIMCGAFELDAETVASLGADAVVCGEMRYHEALELSERGVRVVQAGHHGTERFFVKLVEKWIKDQYPGLDVVCAGFSDSPLYMYNGRYASYDN